jgi:hypothetical protein
MKMVSTMVMALAVAACLKSTDGTTEPVGKDEKPVVAAAVVPPVVAPPPVSKLEDVKPLLQAKGLNVSDMLTLPGSTIPGCKEDTRTRLVFGSDEFLNVSRFVNAADAGACMQLYKDAVLKGGQAAWDRLGPLISTHDKWLYLFSEKMTDGTRRDLVLSEVKKVQ